MKCIPQCWRSILTVRYDLGFENICQLVITRVIMIMKVTGKRISFGPRVLQWYIIEYMARTNVKRKVPYLDIGEVLHVEDIS